ncbi:MAG: ribulose-phosphate 3-epimerase [Spirochaetia bacterium]|nr:ribulose-phosphate 3-epimerase [Spirochaetia bacterium]
MAVKKIAAGISPSLMCGNSFLQNEYIAILNNLDITWYHIDFMDGHFVPNIGMNLNFIRDLRKVTDKQIEVHLMCTTPLDWIEKLILLGADAISFHIEAAHAPIRCLKLIKDNGVLAGIALSPGTSPERLQYLLNYLDYITLMGVEPGFEGQNFLVETFLKTETLSRLIENHQSKIFIQIDGGVDLPIGRKLLELGADILVGGVPTVFKSNNLQKNYELFSSLFTK